MFSFVYKSIDYAHKLNTQSDPGEEFFKHIHKTCEILYFIRGNTQITVESETRQLREGDLVFIPTGSYHFLNVDFSEPYERYVLKFPENILPDFVREKLVSGHRFYTNCKKFDVIYQLFDTYNQTYTDEERYALFLCETIKLTTLLCHEAPQSYARHGDFVHEVIEYIHANLEEPITMKTLSEHFHYSPSFISTEFKKSMHIPIMQYVRVNKLIGAHQMILGGMKKGEAAERYGFESYSTFYRAYKQLLEHDEA
jgi:AraC-like DNA-binding protein